MANFVHLHLHTEYSLLDGISKIKPLIAEVKALGMNACAITDHGVMYGAHEFWTECKKNDIKPIIGCEVYIAERTRFDKQAGLDQQRYHLTLLAKNKEGYHNLVKMVSAGFLEGFYYKPRVDREILKKYGKGIIALSGCLSSNFNRLLAEGKRVEAVEWLKFLDGCFDELYVEIQRNGIPDSENLIPTQIEIAKELKLPVVATNDTHYLHQEDHKVQEIVWCISDGRRLDDPQRRQYGSTEFYLKGPEQMTELYADMPEVVENSQKLADGVELYNIEFERVQPQYDAKMSQDQIRDRLRENAYAGAKTRYPKITPEIKERLDYELKTITDKGYDDYFLVVQDYVNWAKAQGIVVGPGRGSGAGSLVSYSLGITNLCPFKYDLIFERFLNPERPSPPDFDIDFQDDRRDELFHYTSERYGKAKTAYIGTYGKLKSKAAIRDVSRVMGIDLKIADKLSKMVIVKFGRVHSTKKMLAEVPEFAEIVNSDPQLIQMIKYVEKLEDVARHMSVHPCGYLITPEETDNYLPLQLESKGGDKIVTQFEGSAVEYLGLMKFDFLGLRNLTIISNVIKQIKYSLGLEIDIDQIPLDDKKTFELFQQGNTTAIFQFESEGMKKYLRDLKPSEFEDLIFMNAAYRPGAMNYIPDYIKRKNKEQEVTYPDDCLTDILKPTYGFAIYQEQVINIAVTFAGYGLGEADLLRRAMGKKKPEIMEKEKEKFVEKAISIGRDKDKALEIFSYLEPFADYGFNRSHSAAYAMIAYQTAYLKANHPLQFMAGLMQTDINIVDKLKRDLAESKHMGIQVLAPDINKSFYSFSIENDTSIRFGLGGIKGAGQKVMKAIADERLAKGEYTSLDDLVTRVGTAHLSKKDLEVLIKVGAMLQFGECNGLLAVMPGVFDRNAKSQSVTATGQKSLFDAFSTASTVALNISTPVPNVAPVGQNQRLQWEKELLGLFISSHPLEQYFWAGLMPDFKHIDSLKRLREGTKVKILAVVDTMKTIRTKADNKPMSFLALSDQTGECEAVLFNSIHEKYAPMLAEAKVYLFNGSVSFRNEGVSILINEVTTVEELDAPKKVKLDITNIQAQDEIAGLKDCFDEEGEVEVVVMYGNRTAPKLLNRRMHLTEDCIKGIQKYLAKE